ncbi:hydrogenase [Vibrio sp. MACH09]|uniref:cytochrome b/b6 domain-containing protein n=1 Tax=Vibrio sp. MACH09 TaxID=3025122 RepID=UPI00278CAC5D|nr:cytochrome b/b6 domain-containing protein [Vibrio sp. MACH09]GLO61328.1 hydrogenase [Vibrio sp. MACH09]
MRVWDLPTRLYHWFQVILVAGLMYTGSTGEGPHTKLGLLLVTLILWRVLWGFIGSETSRFLQFVKSPIKVLAYLQGKAKHAPGHNPAGAYMVIVMISALFFQALTGLALAGYLDPLPGSETWLSDEIFDYAVIVHENGITALYVLIAIHLSAIALYKLKAKPLVMAMITGEQGSEEVEVSMVSNKRALVALLFCLTVTVGLYLLSLD